MKTALSILILLAMTGQASADTIFSGWVLPGQSLNADGKAFMISLSEDTGFIFFQEKTSSIAVEKQKCEKEDTLEFCFLEVLYDTDLGKTKASIRISENLPAISIQRDIGKSTLYLGEKTNISVRIKNAGVYSAYNANYQDSLEGFTISDVYGCEKTSNSVIWKGTLKVNETKTCNYYITPTSIFEKTTKAKLEYTDSEQRTIYSPAISFSTLQSIETKLYASTDVDLGNLTKITLNISSKTTNDTQKIKARLYLSKGLSFNKSSDFKAESGYYFWNGTISGPNSTSLDLYALPTGSGYAEISASVDYYLLGKNYTSEAKKTMNVKKKDLKLSKSISADAKFDEGSEQWIKITADNENLVAKLKNLKIIVDSQLFSPNPYIFKEINQSTSQIILIIKTVLPYTTMSRTDKFNLNYTYETEFGEKSSGILEGKIITAPIAKVEITCEASTTSPKSEDTVTITTKARNARSKNIKDVKISDDSILESGSNFAILALNASETKTAYVYKIKMPYVSSEKSINITTSATYAEGGVEYAYNLTKELKITKKDLKISVDRTQGEALRGNTFSNTYAISNTLSEEISDVKLILRKQPGFDMPSAGQEYSMQKLLPGEKISFTLDLKAKDNKTTAYEGEILLFKDARGTLYEQNITGESLTVKYAQTNSPIIYVERFAPEMTEGKPSQVNITISNAGADASINLIDDSRSWNIFIPSGRNQTISYNKTFFSNGTFELKEAEARYDYFEKNMSSYSKKTQVKVKKAIAESKEIKTEEKETIGSDDEKKAGKARETPAGDINSEEISAEISQEESSGEDSEQGMLARFAELVRFILDKF